jgi:hypothetical protein
MILHLNQKSKKRRKPKKVVAQYQEWLTSVKNTSSSFSGKKNIKSVMPLKQPEPFRRETPVYKSLPFTGDACSRPPDKFYTGDKMLGIGTLHKSNAVPIFSKEDAKDQANMRR